MQERDAQAPFLLEKNNPSPFRIHPEISDAVMNAKREKELVQKSIDGCADSFGQLFELHKDRVHKHVYYMVGNAETAEDLTGSTFENAFKAIPRYQITGAPFVSWLLRIAHNQGVSHLRAKKEATYIHKGIIDQSPRVDVHSQAEIKEDMRLVFGAVDLLSPGQKTAIRMKFLDGLEYGEIAEAMGVTESNVRVKVHRGLKKLKADLVELNTLDNSGEGVA